MLIIKENPDKQEFDVISKRIEQNDGYCLCAMFNVPETKCICEAFKQQDGEGYCHCKRYVKEEQ